jgi:hypothetical protein
MAIPSQYASLPGANDDLSGIIIAEAIPSIIIPIIAVALRFWSRWINKKVNVPRFWWDDWLCLASLVSPPMASLNVQASVSYPT